MPDKAEILDCGMARRLNQIVGQPRQALMQLFDRFAHGLRARSILELLKPLRQFGHMFAKLGKRLGPLVKVEFGKLSQDPPVQPFSDREAFPARSRLRGIPCAGGDVQKAPG